MSGDLVAVHTLGKPDLAAWDDLALGAAEPNPFFERSWVVPGARHLDDGPTGLLVARDAAGRWIGAMPVQEWHRFAASSWRSGHCPLGTPLLREDCPALAMGALLDTAAARYRTILYLPRVGLDGPVAQAITAAAEARGRIPAVVAEKTRATLHRRADAEYLLENLRGRQGKALRRRRRLLDLGCGGDVRVRDRAGDPAAIDEFLRVEALAWKGGAGTALAGNPGDERFFRDVCNSLVAQDRLQMLALEAGGETAAMQCNIVSNGVVFHFKIGYDPRFARFSPGTLLELEGARRFHESADQMWMDSCADPGDATINRLWSGRRRIAWLAVPLRGMGTHLVAAAAAHALRLRMAHRARRRSRPVSA